MAKKPTSLSVKFPIEYPRSMYANRVAVTHATGFTIAHFGLVDDSGSLLDRFSFVLSSVALASNRDNIVSFSDHIGEAKRPNIHWTPSAQQGGLPLIDFLHLSDFGGSDEAEICLCYSARGPTSDQVRSEQIKQFVPVFGLAMIRCDRELQKAFVEALYPPR